MRSVSRHFVLAALLLGPLFPAACDAGGVVGGDCATGYTLCEGACVDLKRDPRHCGSCERSCPASVSCVSGVCGGDAAAGSGGRFGSGGETSAGGSAGKAGDASVDGSGGAVGGAGEGTGGVVSLDASDGSAGSAGSVGTAGSAGVAGAAGADASDAGAAGDAGDGCTPPFDTAQQCGDCTTRCSGATPLCAVVDGGYACVPMCPPPLVDCNNQCVDLNSDPLNCGRCNNVCPTGLCQGGTCVGATVGHIVLMCMNYEQSLQNAPQTVLLGNAVFLPLRNPVRILAYDEHTPTANKSRVDTTIGWAASARGRMFNTTSVSTAGDVLSQLSVLSYDVFLIHDQPNAPAGVLGSNGSLWSGSLDAFARAGGTIVVLSGGGGTAEMDELMTSAGLLSVSAENDATSRSLFNRAPADAVAVGVLSPFLSLRRTCTFVTSEAPSSTNVFVVTDAAPDAGAGSPVVVHRIKSP